TSCKGRHRTLALINMVSPADTYQLMRNPTSPAVAITCDHGGKRNGMILVRDIRPTLLPTIPRGARFVLRLNTGHDMSIVRGGRALHRLKRDQFELIQQLGFVHRTEKDKLAGIPHHLGQSGVPVLDECYAHFECSVINAMGTGSSTCFLCDVLVVG